MTKRYYLFVIVLMLVAFSSCTVKKRRYMSGYYFHSHKGVEEISKLHTAPEQIIPISPSLSSSEQQELIQSYAPNEPIQIRPKETVCDTVYLTSGARMIVKVTKVYKNRSYYLLCDSDNQAEFEIETDKIKRVVYANGKIDSLKELGPDPLDYYHARANEQKPFQAAPKTNELERARKNADLALVFMFLSILLPYFFIPAVIIANGARKRLKDKRGYEKAYRRANIITIIGLVALGLFLLALAFMIVLLLVFI